LDAQAPAKKPPDGDYTYQSLVRKVVRGDGGAWQEFVEQFSNLLFSLIWRYANGDQDLCSDLYLYVIDGLQKENEQGEKFYRLKRYLQSISRYEGKGRLSTWLGRVTQNLVSDYFREQEGRKTLPRAIQRLALVDQKIFKLLYWDCLSESEAYEVIRSEQPDLGRDRFDGIILKINGKLKKCNRWSIYSEVIRRTPALPLYPVVDDKTETSRSVQVPDSNPASQPGQSAIIGEQQQAAESMAHTLRRAIGDLEQKDRSLLVYRFRHGMTAKEIATLTQRSNVKSIYADIEKLKQVLRDTLQEAGFNWENVSDGLTAIEGMLDEFDPQGKRAG